MYSITILFRVDGNSKIGLGHIYRCIAIADMVSSVFKCEFIVSEASTVQNIIQEKYVCHQIPGKVAAYEEAEWIKTNFNRNVIIILDGYHFDSQYQKKLKETGVKLVYIDDLFEQHMYADIVINHSPDIKSSVYRKESYTKLCLGLEYVLLRKSFLNNSAKESKLSPDIKNILITLGGSDTGGLTEKIVNSITKINNITTLNIVFGASNSNTFKSNNFTSGIKDKEINIHSNLSETEMYNLMHSCDSAIAPCSTTCLELISVGKPMFIGYTAQNQMHLYNYLNSKNIFFDLGNLNNLTEPVLEKIISEKITLHNTMKEMISNQKKLIDGKSSSRIIEIIKAIS